VNQLFTKTLPKLLEKYAHGSVHSRAFANYAAQHYYPYALNRDRCIRVLCYNKDLFKKPVKFYGKSTADFTMMVQLLKQGLDWFMVTEICTSEKETGLDTISQAQRTKDYADLCATLKKKHLRIRKYRGIDRVTFNPKSILEEAKGAKA
jgi:hypothetical protein